MRKKRKKICDIKTGNYHAHGEEHKDDITNITSDEEDAEEESKAEAANGGL
jgi:hypothetical protein